MSSILSVRPLGFVVVHKTQEGNYKGRENLKWFYPGELIQILRHLFVNSHHMEGKNPQLRREMFEGISLFMYDLWVYGMGTKNQTRDSEFSKAFMARYLWQALLKSQIEEHSNYNYQKM